MKKRGLVISVGGSKGSYAGGILEYYLKNGITYDNLYGSSIGSLIIPFAAIGDYPRLKEAFTTTTMSDIFNNNPFKYKQQSGGIWRYTISYWNVFKNIVLNKKSSLGDSRQLRISTIPKFLTEGVYDQILNSDKELKIMVTNISTGELEEKSLKDNPYEKFMDWMWASTCAPPFMSIAEIDECHYTDGGVLNQIPIKSAILDGCNEIDVILLAKEGNDWPIEHIRNSFHYQMKLLLLMMNKIKDYQIDLGYLSHHANKKVKINFHYTERRMTNNSLIFDNELMLKWWEEGYEYAESKRYKSYLIDGRNNSYEEIK
jgi:NTE family protein